LPPAVHDGVPRRRPRKRPLPPARERADGRPGPRGGPDLNKRQNSPNVNYRGRGTSIRPPALTGRSYRTWSRGHLRRRRRGGRRSGGVTTSALSQGISRRAPGRGRTVRNGWAQAGPRPRGRTRCRIRRRVVADTRDLARWGRPRTSWRGGDRVGISTPRGGHSRMRWRAFRATPRGGAAAVVSHSAATARADARRGRSTWRRRPTPPTSDPKPSKLVPLLEEDPGSPVARRPSVGARRTTGSVGVVRWGSQHRADDRRECGRSAHRGGWWPRPTSPRSAAGDGQSGVGGRLLPEAQATGRRGSFVGEGARPGTHHPAPRLASRVGRVEHRRDSHGRVAGAESTVRPSSRQGGGPPETRRETAREGPYDLAGGCLGGLTGDQGYRMLWKGLPGAGGTWSGGLLVVCWHFTLSRPVDGVLDLALALVDLCFVSSGRRCR